MISNIKIWTLILDLFFQIQMKIFKNNLKNELKKFQRK